MDEPVTVALGRHVFGAVRAPDERVAEAAWGSEPGQVGLAGSRELGFTGPSSFDVETDGTVDVLDSVNGRVMRWGRGRREHVPISGALALADFASEPDGSFDILQDDTVRHLRADGTQKWAQRLAERTWAKLAHGASVLQQPSEQWMPVSEGGLPLTRPEQRRAGHAAQQGVLADRVGEAELRVAVLRGKAPLRSWRITSATPLGEVQMAEPHGNGIVVVTRAYTDDRDEFVVLVLGPDGLVQRFSVESGSWTETAPLARFRLARGELYRLRTTQAGAYVDRFDLEVPQ